MKHLSIAVILFLTVIGNINASPLSLRDELNFVGANNFRHQFPDATGVSYKVKGQFTEVDFIWNGMQLQAYYDMDGNTLATARIIDRNSLPLNVQLSIKKNYSESVITTAFEYADANDGLCYYVTVANAKVTYILHVSTSGDISVFKKMKH